MGTSGCGSWRPASSFTRSRIAINYADFQDDVFEKGIIVVQAEMGR